MPVSAFQGIEILENEEIDLVLMDLRMPHMSGFEVSELIRKHKSKAIRQIPIIALTAAFTTSDRKKAEMYKINDYLLKPYSSNQMLLKLLTHTKNTIVLEKNTTAYTTTGYINNQEVKDFDLEYIVEECENKLDLVKEFIRLFKQNVFEFVGDMKCHFDMKDYDAMEFSLHKIQSSLVVMQTEKLQNLVLEMETYCKIDKNLSQVIILFESFITAYCKIEGQIDIAFQKLKINE